MISPALQIFLTRRDTLDRLRHTSTTGAEILRKMKRNFSVQDREIVRRIVEETALSDLKSYTRSRSTIDALIKVLSIPYYDTLPFFDRTNLDEIDSGKTVGDESWSGMWMFQSNPSDVPGSFTRFLGTDELTSDSVEGWRVYVNDDLGNGTSTLRLQFGDGSATRQTIDSTVVISQGDLFVLELTLNIPTSTWTIRVWNITTGISESRQSEVYLGTASFDGGNNYLIGNTFNNVNTARTFEGITPYIYDVPFNLTVAEGDTIYQKMLAGLAIQFPSNVYPFFDPDNNDYIDSGQTGFGAYDDTWYGRVKLDATNWVDGASSNNFLLTNNFSVSNPNVAAQLVRSAIIGQIFIRVNDGVTSGIFDITTNGSDIGDDIAWVIYADESAETISARIKNITQDWTETVSVDYSSGTHDFDSGSTVKILGTGSTRDTAGAQTYFGRIHKAVSEAQADEIISQMEAGEVTFGGYNFISNSDSLSDFYAVSSGTFPTITTGQEDSDGGSNAIKVDHLADGQTDLSRIMMQFSPNAPTGDGFLLPNQTYTFSVWAKGEVGGEALTIYRYDASPDNSSEAVVLTTEWVRYDFTFTFADFDPASEIANIQLRSGSNSAQTMYFHKAMINQGTTALDYESGGATVFPFGLNRRALDTEVTGLLNGSGNNLTTVGIDFEGNDIRITATIKTDNSQGILFNEEDGTGPFFLCWENGNTGSSTGSQTSLTIDGIDHTSSNRDELHTALTDGAFHDIELVFDGDLIQQGSKQILLNEFPSFRATIYYANQIGIDIGNTGELDHTYLPSGVATTEGTSDMSLTGNVVDGVRYYADDTDGGKIIYQNTGTIELQTIADNILRDMPDLNRRAVDDEMVYESNFSAGTDSWGNANGATVLVGDTDYLGVENYLQGTAQNGLTEHIMQTAVQTVIGQKYRVLAEVVVPSGNSVVDGFDVRSNSATKYGNSRYYSVTPDETIYVDTGVFTADSTKVRFYMANGSVVTIDADGDQLFIRNLKLIKIGYADTGDGAGPLNIQMTSVDGILPKVPSDIDLFKIRHPELAA